MAKSFIFLLKVVTTKSKIKIEKGSSVASRDPSSLSFLHMKLYCCTHIIFHLFPLCKDGILPNFISQLVRRIFFMDFKGFEKPNFTQIPNEYLDYTLSKDCDLSALEMRIMNFFFRETYGWHEKNAQLAASVTDFQAMFNIQKRQSITNALDHLTNEKHFLQSVQIKELPESTRKYIQKALGRTLQPAQKLYRLNLKDSNKKGWDNLRDWQTSETKMQRHDFLLIKKSKENLSENEGGYQSVHTSGYQSVHTSGYQSVHTSGYQSVHTSESENLGTVSETQTLNKVLNKELNKSLNKNTYLDEIDKINLPVEIKRVLSEMVGRLVSDSINLFNLEIHYWANVDKYIDKYEYASVLKWYLENAKNKIVDIAALMDKGINRHIEFRNQKNNHAAGTIKKRQEILPEWFEENQDSSSIQKNIDSKTLEDKKREIEEMLRMLDGNV